MFSQTLIYFSQRTFASNRPLDFYCLGRFPLAFRGRGDDWYVGFSRTSFFRSCDQSYFD